MPVGVDEIELPETATVKATRDPWNTMARFGVMVSVVTGGGLMVSDDVPVLVE
jgi:hypothetical protein